MKKLKLPFVLCLLLAGQALFAQNSEIIRTYIASYKDIAMEEMVRTGVPASITLAQGIHETFAGQSKLVKESNNHFGIKCKSDWKGESVTHDDDARGECFRKYTSAADSYRDHSDFLKNRPHYASLFTIDPTDYESWAWGLKKAGYATNPKYPQILIKLIKDYNLQDYTLIALGKKEPGEQVIWASRTEAAQETATAPAEQPMGVSIAPRPSYPSGTFRINETSVVYAEKGTSFLALAQEHNIPLSRLFDFNDMTPVEEAAQGQLIYLQRKRKTGVNEIHVVAQGETLYDIAQTEGIRMENLLAYNQLKPGMQPRTGEKIYLKEEAPAMPKLASASPVAPASIKIVRAEREEDYLVHVVQPKETLYSITKKYSVSLDDVVKWNNLPSPDLKTGQELRINKK
jgi:LysM repeat protein